MLIMCLSAISTLLKENCKVFENDGGLLYHILGQQIDKSNQPEKSHQLGFSHNISMVLA